MNFIVLSSSRGTTLQAVLDAMAIGDLRAKCLGLIADKDTRGCVTKAHAVHLPTLMVHRPKGISRELYDEQLIGAIEALGGDDDTIIACIGWMFILSPHFVQKFRGRILNVHPALLPKHPGANAISDALEAGDTETGMTIHLIDEGVDTGPIIKQDSCPIYPEDTEEELKQRIQKLEKKWYPKVLQGIEDGSIDLATIGTDANA